MVVTNMEDNGRKLFCFFLLLLLLFDSPNTDENDVMTDSRRDERHITSGPLSACSGTTHHTYIKRQRLRSVSCQIVIVFIVFLQTGEIVVKS